MNDINTVEQIKEDMVKILDLEDTKTEIENEITLNNTVERFWIPMDELDARLMHYPSTHYRKDDSFLPGKMIDTEQEAIKARTVDRQLRKTVSSRIEYLQKEINNMAMRS